MAGENIDMCLASAHIFGLKKKIRHPLSAKTRNAIVIFVSIYRSKGPTKKLIFCLGFALTLMSLGVAAKEATPNDMNKHRMDIGKKERRIAPPETSDQTTDWQPYLRWHRDATSLQGANDRPDALGRSVPYTQL